MEFVDFNLAKKLKEMGFKDKCIAYYWEKINEHTPFFVVEDNMPEGGICIRDLISEHNKAEWSHFIDAPTISQVLKWLRDEKKISIEIGIHCSLKWMCSIYEFSDGLADFTQYKYDEINDTLYILYDTYEQAALAGIEYVLDNLI